VATAGSNAPPGAQQRELQHPDLPFVAYCLHEGAARMPLVPAPARRSWMGETSWHAAYHCLPMVVANQAGWLIMNGHTFTVRWSGGDDLDALKIFYRSGAKPYPAVSVFGHGILTFQLPYLFRTPPGFDTLVRGPANWPRDGASPLEGLVETDWAPATFTMNWQITRPDHTISFNEDEPIAMVAPQPRGGLEQFRPALQTIDADPDLAAQYGAWAKSRREFIGVTRLAPPQSPRLWQDDYRRGTSSDGPQAPLRHRALRLRSFRPTPIDEPQVSEADERSPEHP
jgi:hypothetical protein